MAQVHFDFEQTNFEYSLKNIAEPSQKEYLISFINQVRSLVTRVRWRAFHILYPSNRERKKTYGFNTTKPPPILPELSLFEEKMFNLIQKIQFHKRGNSLQTKLKEDIRKMKREPKLIVPADKTSNFYKTEVETYNILLQRNVEAECKRGPQDLISTYDREDKALAEELDITDRTIHKTEKRESFITFKDHKDNFRNNPKCRLINPTKTELGKVAKIILENVVHQAKEKSGLNLWRSTQSAVQWFKNIPDKERKSFIKFDIVSYYPNISKKLLSDALNWAQQYVTITDQDKQIIFQSCRAVLVSDDKIWVKKGDRNEEKFAVTIGSNMGAEAAEICTTFLLSRIKQTLPNVNAGCYRDDGLLVTHARPQEIENQKKKLCELFSRHGLSIEATANVKVIDFLDVLFDLNKNIFAPYRKPGDSPKYVHDKSDHPRKILKNVPVSVQKRLSGISSNEEVFRAAAPTYQRALNEAGYDHILTYEEDAQNNNTEDQDDREENNNNRKKRKRNRNLTYFTPPFSMTVKTRIGKEFLKIVDTAFPPSNALHKKLNRHNIKISYSCMPNMKTRISRHNTQHLNRDRVQASELPCNCRQVPCPIPGQNQCRAKNAVYQATVTVPPRPEVEDEEEEVQTYVGASHDFKERYYGHRSSFNLEASRTSTTLSKFVWKLKDEGRQYRIRWKIIDRGAAYRPAAKRCNLCLKEKYWIIFHPEMASLNDHSEIWRPCMHKQSTFLKKA